MSEAIQIGDFRIERQIGAGGMGIVYLATQISLNRKVALKVLGQSLQRPADVARFQREAQAIAKLNHPSIATVYFVGQDKKLCYMAMEFIDGVSLHACIDRLTRIQHPDSTIDSVVAQDDEQPELIRFDVPDTQQETNELDGSRSADKTPINPYRSPQAESLISSDRHIRRVTTIVRDVATALAHAHEQNVVHRDLKPGNLMLDRSGAVHVIDFGLATFLNDASLTQTGAIVGTPIYMSPEQVTGRFEIDHRTDIYSLGLVLYELLALRRPISATNREGVLRKIVMKPLLPISQLNGDVPEALERIVHKATAKDADERYQTAKSLASDLDQMLANGTVTAPAYHYRTSYLEIGAERPNSVLLVSSWLLAIGLICSLLLLSWCVVVVESLYDPELGSDLSLNTAFTGLIGLSAMICGWGIMFGKRWGRYGAAATLVLLGLVLNVHAIRQMSGSPFGTMMFLSMFLFAGTASFILGIFTLVDKRITRWVRFAYRVRSEDAEG